MGLLLVFKNKTKDNTNYPEGGKNCPSSHGMDMTTPHIETSTINRNRTDNTGRAIRMLTRENRESATYDVNQRARG